MMSKRSILILVFALVFTLGFTQIMPAFSAAKAETLLPDEQNTVEVFQKASPKVVFVHRLAVSKRHDQQKHDDGAGSGIIWDNNGYVVTNYHVIKDADSLEVTVGKMTVPAEVVGKEPRTDIAVLKIKSPQVLDSLKTFQPFRIIHLNDMMVGQKAIAIGNPFGLDHSLSKGIISALGRDVPGAGGVSIPNMIQTDTPINPGNSGGPLLSSSGELLGINTIIFSKTGTSAGIGFAIPADDIANNVDQIIKHGRVILSGIGIQQVDGEEANHLGVKKGILIANVLPNTPAAQAKLQGTHKNVIGRVILGDVIVAVNAHQIDDYDELYRLLTKVKVGENVTVSIQRGNKQMDIKMKTIDVSTLDASRGKNLKTYNQKFLSA